MLLPRPTTATYGHGTFLLDESTRIHASGATAETAHWLQSVLRPATGLPLPLTGQAGTGLTLALDPELPVEGYRLHCGPDGVTITGADSAGVFYGCQTLRQLLPAETYRAAPVPGVAWKIRYGTVQDAPRFRWRGTMLDVARHFMPKPQLLRFIDLLALHRINTLHLHLTDDQGWRVQIMRHPRLTEAGAWRRESQRGAAPDAPGDQRPHGGYYTQDDLREIVAYAAQRHITVVPEIDVPGHSQAAIAAYPELGVSGEQLETGTRWGINSNILNAEESTLTFFYEVLDEVMDLFPAPFVGIGGDECPTEQWDADPRTQELIRERGLADSAELRSWFLGRLGRHLAQRGRRVFAWDEILEGEAPRDTLVASWRGMTGARTAARRGHDVIACPDDLVYLDYRQSELESEPIPFGVPLTLADAYDFDPVPDGLTETQQARIVGGQANIWTEHMDSPRTVDYYAFPRLCAIAEALWSNADRDFEDFQERLRTHLRRLDALGVEYRRVDGPMPWQTRPGVPGKTSSRVAWAEFIDTLVAPIKT
ncbi:MULTISPECIES: beta-N-acetylhexosaminidase [unclassified Streptomyces]|uniref:beta-N-acetylhexosaminidase n=1 Tax=unclassified Streptomyces TaxID=2593676 RepID=UPI002ED1842F|nr:beta-N-acetylhexosaminidase [Streptomyces sp. NBC_00891]WSY03569.1 beta-N-acetylhexosaminidase [Streptomyces sp. NBC_00890]WSZ05196.1 beta-N-acetylhexosaminidase [Streptomyces sp. NBC_00869]WSZ27309.1 beta-N-acetylhexosaminidase [Streptomyces sp. NBC_00870]